MRFKKALTLLELVIVIIISGILSTLGIVRYAGIKESGLDKEAFANLKLLRVAEGCYRVDIGNYYPVSGSIADNVAINNNLRVSLPSAANKSWNYAVYSNGCVKATRNVTGGRDWSLKIDDLDGDPDSGALCP